MSNSDNKLISDILKLIEHTESDAKHIKKVWTIWDKDLIPFLLVKFYKSGEIKTERYKHYGL